MRPRKPGRGFTGHWNHERFLGMLRARSIEPAKADSIEQRGEAWVVLSEDGDVLDKYELDYAADSEAAARARLRQLSPATEIANRITAHRRERDHEADAVDPRTVRRWLSGEQDPSKGAGGREPYIWEICLVFDVDPAWLMTGEAKP